MYSSSVLDAFFFFFFFLNQYSHAGYTWPWRPVRGLHSFRRLCTPQLGTTTVEACQAIISTDAICMDKRHPDLTVTWLYRDVRRLFHHTLAAWPWRLLANSTPPIYSTVAKVSARPGCIKWPVRIGTCCRLVRHVYTSVPVRPGHFMQLGLALTFATRTVPRPHPIYLDPIYLDIHVRCMRKMQGKRCQDSHEYKPRGYQS